MPQEYQEVAEEIRDLGTVKGLLGDQFVEGMEVVDVRNVVVVGDESQVNWPIDITFEVPGVLTTTKVAVLHYSDDSAISCPPKVIMSCFLMQATVLETVLSLKWTMASPFFL